MSEESVKPRLIVVAGPNGTGKTSITEQLLRHEWMGGCVYINPDFIARDEFGDWNAPDAINPWAREILREIRNPQSRNTNSMAITNHERVRRIKSCGLSPKTAGH